jgi:hypothetical protein
MLKRKMMHNIKALMHKAGYHFMTIPSIYRITGFVKILHLLFRSRECFLRGDFIIVSPDGV